MNLGGWRFFVFALVGLGGIALIASIGVPREEEVTVDRYTGERVVVVRTVADAIAEARLTGNARHGLAAIERRLEQFPEDEILTRLQAVLLAELSAHDGEPPPSHPRLAELAAERERARAARREIRERAAERLPLETLLALLWNLEADRAISEETERLFAPLARWKQEHEEAPYRPDETAARLLAAADREPPQDPEPFFRLARAFRSEGRPRARIRWLLRAFGAFPDSAAARDELIRTYLEYTRLVEAFLVVGAALEKAPDDLDLWRTRARVAGWLSLPTEEAEAQSVLLAHGEDPAIRERLITLYTATGRLEEAVPHARALAAGSDDPERLERPAKLALQAGLVDEALAHLDELARTTGRPVYWREKIVEYATQDLRIDRIVEELDKLRKLDPEGGYEEQLVGVLRRRKMLPELEAVLSERLDRRPDDRELEQEVLALRVGLGDEDGARTILMRQIRRTAEPREFFENLPTYQGLGLDVSAHAPAMAEAEALRASDVPYVLRALVPYLENEDFRKAGRIAARRFPRVPEARDFLLHDLDRSGEDHEAARAAEALALEHPEQPAFLEAWIDRATWAGDVESEIRARERWLATHPDDAENRAALADRLAGVDRLEEAADQWRHLSEQEGLGSDATLRLIDALFAAGHLEEGVALLERRAQLPGTSNADRLHVAEQLFAGSHLDRALPFYMAVLDLEPKNPTALLRVGQVRSWTNDPRGAIPFLEQRLKVSEEDEASVRFYLGDAYWAVHENATARRHHERALDLLLPKTERVLGEDIMVAKMLSRLGRVEEARPIFERVVEAAPGQVDLILDYADAMAAVADTAKARDLVERARAVDAFRARTMRLDGKVAVLEGRYEDAAVILQASLDRHGPDAGTESELARALDLAGQWAPAREAYRRSLALQPGNRDLQRALQRVSDELAHYLHGAIEYRGVGDDAVMRAFAAGTLRLPDERLRVAASLGFADFTGRAAAVDNGNTDVAEQVALLGVSGFYRFARTQVLGAGIEAYPGAPGDAAAGGWAGVLLTGHEPYRALRVRVHAHLLLEEPAAAVGLGGRTSGAELYAQHDLFERFWAGATLRYQSLSLESPSETDGLFEGGLTFGWRVLEGEPGVADRYRIDRTTRPGLVGPDVDGDPALTPGPLVDLWAGYQSYRLLDGRELAGLIPVAVRQDYLTLGGRAEFHVAPGLGAKLEGLAGYEFETEDTFFNLEGGATWRPGHATELTLAGGYGRAFGRTGDTDALHVRVGFTYRW